jgi:hypothetical protein
MALHFQIVGFPKMIDGEGLSDADLKAISRVVGDACTGTGPVRARRKSLFNQTCKLIHANFWGWAYSYLPDGEEKPTVTDWQVNGTMWIGARLAYGIRVFNAAKKQPPENIELARLTREGKHFTRRFTDLVGQARWRSDPEVLRFVKSSNLGHHIYSLYPLCRSANRVYISGVAFFRPVDQSDFAARECQIVHRIVRAGLGLLIEGLSSAYEQQIPKLKPRLYRILPFLAEGFTEDDLRAQGYFDIEDAAREIYQVLNVSGRAELMARYGIDNLNNSTIYVPRHTD